VTGLARGIVRSTQGWYLLVKEVEKHILTGSTGSLLLSIFRKGPCVKKGYCLRGWKICEHGK
jgi:hypothetical protein